MKILGIESSCDDTSVALLEADESGFRIINEKTASQVDVHKKYGGVIPEIAGRQHAEAIMPVIEEVLGGEKPDVIAATTGPGLITGLIVGAETARTLSYLWDIPLVSTNHIAGHIHSVLLSSQHEKKEIQFPALCLIVSGGHTELVLMKNHDEYELLGKTRDDAAGEAFDKVAKLLDLEYPGGPKISKLALTGNTKAIQFPRPMMDSDDFDMSFAGLKTSALYWLRDNSLSSSRTTIFRTLFKQFLDPKPTATINDFCASFEQAIIDVLVQKTLRAIGKYKPQTLILSGGVSANKKLREELQSISPIPFLYPELKYCMDNAAMIAVAGYYKAIKKEFINWRDVRANPNWEVYEEDNQ